MRNLAGVVRCACHHWPWYDCPDIVPFIDYGVFRGLLIWWRDRYSRGELKGIIE